MIRNSLRVLWNESWFSALFVLNLSLGLAAFLMIQGFKDSLDRSLESQAQALLGGDLAVSARRPFTEIERSTIQSTLPSDTRKTEAREFFAMVTGARSTLLTVRAVDGSFPLAGEITLESADGSSREAKFTELQDEPKVWLDSAGMDRLGLEVGESVRIGEGNFRVDAKITADPQQGSRFTGFGGIAYIGATQLEKTQLLRPGSTVTYALTFDLQDKASAPRWKEELLKRVPDPAVNVRTVADAGDQSARALTLLGDYLGLSALISLSLSALGALFLLSNFLKRRARDLAVMLALGASPRWGLRLVSTQVAMLSIAALILALVVGRALEPLLMRMLRLLSPVALEPSFGLVPFLEVVAILLLVIGAVFLPSIRKLKDIAPAELFRSQDFLPPPKKGDSLAWIPAVVVFCLFAIWQAKSWTIGAAFIGAIFASCILLALLGWGLRRVLRPIAHSARAWSIREAFRSWERRPREALTIFLAVGLGLVLTNLLPQIAASLRKELDFGDRASLPAVFLFDIQEEQAAPIEKILNDLHVPLSPLSPLVRARILAINEKSFERADTTKVVTREDENEARFRNRGVNLTYRAGLQKSETLVAGEDFSAKPVQTDDKGREVAEISVERRFAGRVGLKLGDFVEFDVQGVSVFGRVRNLRSVRWTSFEPNFFILFPPGVLEAAPKTFLAILPKQNEVPVMEIQRTLAEKFSNVSQVNVAEVIQSIFRIVDRGNSALTLMALLAVVSGLMVVAGVFFQQMQGRQKDILLLCVVGASEKQIQRTLIVEFFSLILGAAITGTALSMLVGAVIIRFFFEVDFSIAWGTQLLSILVIALLTLALLAWNTRRLVRQARPLELIQS